MKHLLLVLPALFVAAAALCARGDETTEKKSEPAKAAKLKIVLAGDSTVTDDAGWGKGFAARLAEGATCVNLAQGGRSSKSYRDEGWWDKCLAAKPGVVLIQFG